MDFFQGLADVPLETVAPGIRRFIFTLERVMCVYFVIEPGTRVAEHAHPHEQMGMLIQGETKWRIQGKDQFLRAPSLYRIPSQVPHEAEILGNEEALILDVFSPIREDFLEGGPPPYMQGRSPG